MSAPRVSVVIATWRRPDRIARAVETALAQTIRDIEVIVAVERDDPQTLAALAAIGDPRVRHVVNTEKRGPGVARDTGARAALAEWVAFLDDDDDWLPAKLEKQLAAADGRGDVIVMTQSRVLWPGGSFVRPVAPYDPTQPIDEWLFDRRSWFGGGDAMLQTSSLMMPRRLFDTLGFGTAQHEEWELAIRAVKQHGYRLVTVAEPLVNYVAGNRYPWAGSVRWAEAMRDVASARALSGFLLTVVPQGIRSPGRTRAFLSLLRAARRDGRPTPKQLFAWALIWAVPHGARYRLRAALGRLRGRR
ncbi:glycosyltransferase family 2 protein [Sphingomonas sp.]|uniref:glycosyltransferase family 2 protein n=1 Tax=Sphingomonas sp. TaxID=28214 RepID=UPI003AFF987D